MSHSNVGIRLHNNQPDYDTTHMKKAADLVWEQKWLLCATVYLSCMRKKGNPCDSVFAHSLPFSSLNLTLIV